MRHFSKTLLIIASILFVVFLVFQPIYNVDAAGLVSCGQSEDDPATTDIKEDKTCETCDVLILGSRVINFVLSTVTPAIAVLLFLIAGFMILLGGANPGLISSGKNIFKTTVYGLLLVFGAWMITNTVLKSLAGNYFDKQEDPWNRVVCVGGTGTGAGAGASGGGDGACSLEPLALITDPAALAMESGATVVWTSSDANVQRNLTKLQQEFNKLQNLMATQVGGSATVNSAYRPYAYQFHLFDIYMASQVYRGNQAFYDSQPVCFSVVAALKAEQQKHGVCSGSGPCLVASPSKCAPHVKGTGVDISISPASFLDAAINTFLQANDVDLIWQALPDDRVHFNLINPPFAGCAS